MKIVLTTVINAPIEICFNLSRSIDLHTESMQKSNEKAIAGKTSGLISLNESVTWRAKHFWINFLMTNKITEMVEPTYFVDEMIRGPFAYLKHEHIFKPMNAQTEMTDIFEFKAPCGIIGKIVERLFLGDYLKRLLMLRNEVIKNTAEKQ